MSRGKRLRIAEGIYRDQFGLAATVKVGRIQREQRFAPDTPLDTIEGWKVQTRADLFLERADADAPIGRGTFAADLPRYLLTIAGRPQYKSDRSHLSAWLPLLAKFSRSAIKPAHLKKGFTAWIVAGRSPRTLRHRKRVIREMWHGLDGASARPPIKGIILPKPDDPHPTPVPVKTIQRVAKSLKAGKRHKKGYGDDSELCYVRFLVRATTGQRPSQIMRAKPSDVDLKRRIWFVRPGKRGTAIPLPLTGDMVRAWKAFAKAEAWGPFDTRSFSKTLRRHGWPADIRPYNLRHTFAIDHLLAGTQIGDLQGLLGHRQIETTRKFYAPILIARLKKASGGRRLKLA